MSTPLAARSLAGLILTLALASTAAAQAGEGGLPPSFTHDFAAPVPVEALPALDVADLLAEDAAAAGKLQPFRFGVGHDVGLDPSSAGVWEDLPGGERVWRLRLESPGAYSLNLVFDRYDLPDGARLWVHNEAGRVLGAFTSALEQPHGMFATEPLAGDALTLEYLEPQAAAPGSLRISQVIHAYKNILGASHQTSGGSTKMSGACNINVNCPLGANWQDDKRSVARLIMGGVLCSGALINNTANDSKQYFLTANHCFSGNPASWIFQFNYESATCNGGSATPQSVTGSILRTKSGAADHCLVEITQQIPSAYNVYFSGWSRLTTPSTTSTGMHHPQGDIKKICQDTNPVTMANFLGSPCWRVASWEFGVTEGGSSGSPLYDQNHRVVGQLYGGQATCSFLFNDYYGRFDVSWNNGLSGFLDPLGTNQLTLDGSYGGAGCGVQIYCTGKVSSAGSPASIGWLGTPSFAQQGFSLTCFNGFVPNVNGIHFWSNTGPNSLPFGGGTLCIAPPTLRGPVHTYDNFGQIAVPITILGSDVGKTRWFQFWFRDLNHPDGTGIGLSDAAEVVFCP